MGSTLTAQRTSRGFIPACVPRRGYNPVEVMMESVTIGNATLYCGDCLDILPLLSGVDAVITDPPYGTTACSWDSVIPLDAMWGALDAVISESAPVLLFGAQPFTAKLITSNLDRFKYCLVWDKISKTDVMNAKNKPMRQHEDIAVFSKGTTANCSPRRMTYNPQGLKPATRCNPKNTTPAGYMGDKPRPSHEQHYEYQFSNYPASILTFTNADRTEVVHPTQKPVPLLKYLVRTYSDKAATILDFTMGSGTTGVAAMEEGRRFFGIEIDRRYFDIACKRIEQAQMQLHLGL